MKTLTYRRLVPALAIGALALAGCSGGGGDTEAGAPPEDAQEEQSPSEWAGENCELQFAEMENNNLAGDFKVMVQGPLQVVPENVNSDFRETVLTFYDYDETSASLVADGDITTEDIFCYAAGREETMAYEEISGRDITAYPIITPAGEKYVSTDLFREFDNGIMFEVGVPEVGPSSDSIAVPEEFDVQSAIDAEEGGSVDYCDVSDCGVG